MIDRKLGCATLTREMEMIRKILALVGLLTLSLGITTTASPSAAAASSPSNYGTSNAIFDPQPGPPYVYSGYKFNSESACIATGRAFLNGGTIYDYTCRYVAGSWRLYVIPGLPDCDFTGVTSPPIRLATRC
ncbi:hypothetical protein [Actinoplanes sp. NPDC051859]|uniref:hypothetical protein n=1 Tax=Actinoplanes sp. NPDC051859 TaxID=3363909 RepID=UPI00378B17D3